MTPSATSSAPAARDHRPRRSRFGFTAPLVAYGSTAPDAPADLTRLDVVELEAVMTNDVTLTLRTPGPYRQARWFVATVRLERDGLTTLVWTTQQSGPRDRHASRNELVVGTRLADDLSSGPRAAALARFARTLLATSNAPNATIGETSLAHAVLLLGGAELNADGRRVLLAMLANQPSGTPSELLAAAAAATS